jgi:hypothetical protein
MAASTISLVSLGVRILITFCHENGFGQRTELGHRLATVIIGNAEPVST